jgi:hypothetical protein
MSDTAKDVLAALEASIQEALDVFELQGERAEAARRMAASTQERFQHFMAAQEAGDTAGLERWRNELRARAEQRSTISDIRETEQLSVRWETAFCDAYTALMRLYAFPELREGAERVASLVRTIRLLQVEGMAAEIESFESPFPVALRPGGEDTVADNSAGGTDPQSNRTLMRRFMEKMETFREQFQSGANQKTDLTERYLREALAAVRELAVKTAG